MIAIYGVALGVSVSQAYIEPRTLLEVQETLLLYENLVNLPFQALHRKQAGITGVVRGKICADQYLSGKLQGLNVKDVYHARGSSANWNSLLLLFLITMIGIAPAISEPIHQRVIGGVDAEDGAWPFMALVTLAGSRDPQNIVACGGTLIDPQHVLTAAHCVVSFDGAVFPNPSALEVLLGRTQLTSSDGEFVGVQEIILPPNLNFNVDPPVPDAALLRLKHPVSYPTAGILIPAHENMMAGGNIGVVLGWGIQHPEFEVLPDTLQQAAIGIVSQQECERRHGLLFTSQYEFCAGELSTEIFAADGIDTCSGDSGGPLLVENPMGGWLVAGITSWGFTCASHQFYGIYTKVPSISDWIIRSLDPVLRIRDIIERLPGRITRVLESGTRPAPTDEPFFFVFNPEVFPIELLRRQSAGELAALEGLLAGQTVVANSYPRLTKGRLRKISQASDRLLFKRLSAKRQSRLFRRLKRLATRILR